MHPGIIHMRQQLRRILEGLMMEVKQEKQFLKI